jgi:hypothetical protein
VVRLATVGLTALIAVIYVLIGLQIVTVIDDPSQQTAFGLIAAAAFAVGSVVLARARGRVIFGLGAAVVAFVIFTYFSLAAERSPQFETWGIVLRVLQVLLFLGLGYMAIRPPARQVIAKDRAESDTTVNSTSAGASAESGPAIHHTPPV